MNAPRRIVIAGLDHAQELLELPEAAGRHVAKVLRLGVGARLLLSDGDGGEVDARIEKVNRGRVTVRLTASRRVQPENIPELHLLQALPKGNKLDEIIRRATELGVASISPVACERSIPRLDAPRAEKRLARWQTIAVEAARQSRRSRVPTISALRPLPEALETLPDTSLPLVLWEESRSRSLAAVLAERQPHQNVVVAIGPEGGFSRDEIDLAQTKGFVSASLGPRILRTETAAIATCAIIQNALGALAPLENQGGESHCDHE